MGYIKLYKKRKKRTKKKEKEVGGGINVKELSGGNEGGGLFSEAPPLSWLLSMKEITVWGNFYKHAFLLPPPLFMINEIRVSFVHRFSDVKAANCLSLSKLEAALFGVCFNIDLLKVMKLPGWRVCIPDRHWRIRMRGK